MRSLLERGRLPPRPRILDYGCGNGEFALAMKHVFDGSDVWASDFHDEVPLRLQGGGISYIDDDQLDTAGTFDFILCRHVLEHSYEPKALLIRLATMLRVGGVIAIEVPNLKAPLRRLFGKYWDGFYAPYHPIHFTQKALSCVVVGAGYSIVEDGGCEMPKIGRSLQNVLSCRYNIGLFAVGALLQPMQSLARLVAQESTCLRLWARKQAVNSPPPYDH